ncbi:MAG: FAD-binding domain-containing protein [Cyanobium sp.]|jgi:deoxyribodipyrimidine photo-lyase
MAPMPEEIPPPPWPHHAAAAVGAPPAAADGLQGVPLGWSAAPGDLPRQFRDRRSLAAWLRRELLVVGSEPPPSPATDPDAGLSPWRGGRWEAERRLAGIDPLRYGRSRNHLDGAVTALSPWIRHGVLSLLEVRDAVATRLAADGLPRTAGERLMAELGWRDYWQRLWRRWGDAIWDDREPFCTGLAASAYAPLLPDDIAAGHTGLACVDAWVAQLHRLGWLHNHVRLWLAAYVVHWRRVRWQAGARWFLRHLLDGDPASNNLSWQWVAGCFSSKPYLFNRSNLERFGGGGHCSSCPCFQRGGPDDPGGCPFASSYEQLQERLFTAAAPSAAIACATPAAAVADGHPAALAPGGGAAAARLAPASGPVVLWIHGEALGPANPALRAYPGAPAVFVFDRELLAGRTATSGGGRGAGEPAPQPLALTRLGFLMECLLELPVSLRHGDVVEELVGFAQRHGAARIITSQAVDPRFERLRARLATRLPVEVLAPEPFAPLDDRQPDGAPLDLRRFSRYWKRAEPLVWAAAEARARANP